MRGDRREENRPESHLTPIQWYLLRRSYKLVIQPPPTRALGTNSPCSDARRPPPALSPLHQTLKQENDGNPIGLHRSRTVFGVGQMRKQILNTVVLVGDQQTLSGLSGCVCWAGFSKNESCNGSFLPHMMIYCAACTRGGPGFAAFAWLPSSSPAENRPEQLETTCPP